MHLRRLRFTYHHDEMPSRGNICFWPFGPLTRNTVRQSEPLFESSPEMLLISPRSSHSSQDSRPSRRCCPHLLPDQIDLDEPGPVIVSVSPGSRLSVSGSASGSGTQHARAPPPLRGLGALRARG